jgi:hypothetical protein
VHIEGIFNDLIVKSHDEIAEIFSHNDISEAQSTKSIFHFSGNDLMVPQYILELKEQIDFMVVIEWIILKKACGSSIIKTFGRNVVFGKVCGKFKKNQ